MGKCRCISLVRSTVHTNPSRKRHPFALLCMDGKHFENGSFRKRWHHDIHRISLTDFCLNTNPVFVLRCNVEEKKI